MYVVAYTQLRRLRYVVVTRIGAHAARRRSPSLPPSPTATLPIAAVRGIPVCDLGESSAMWEQSQRALPSTCWADWENMDGLCESTRQKTGEWSMWVSGTDPPCVASANPPPVGQPYPLLPGWQLLSRPKPLPEPVPHPLVRPGPKLRLPCYIKLSHGIEELIS